MRAEIEIRDKRYWWETDQPLDLSIPLLAWPDQPNAFFAPPFDTTPVREGSFTASIAAGSPVNSFNIQINPHGNGTHTECLAHIEQSKWNIRQALPRSLFDAELVTVHLTKGPNGDRFISRESLEQLVGNGRRAEALIVRTLPNPPEKRFYKYGGNNPPFFALKSMEWITSEGYAHLLCDLPSVDPEKDEGKLQAHREFWHKQDNLRFFKTITELIYIDNSIKDGLYLLDLQILNIDLDASPSRPLIYRLNPL